MYQAASKIVKNTMKTTQDGTDALMFVPKGAAGVAGGVAGGLVGLAAMFFIRTDYVPMPVVGGVVGGAASAGLVEVTSQLVGKTLGLVLSIPAVILGTPVQMALDASAQRELQAREADSRRIREQTWEQERQRQVDRQRQDEIRLQRIQEGVRQNFPSAYSYKRPAVELSDLALFLLERSRFSNKKRIYQALFDKDEVRLEQTPYDQIAKDVYPFFLKKIGNQEIYEHFMNRVTCPIEMDIAEDPVAVPTKADSTGKISGPHTDMIGYKSLLSASAQQLQEGRVFNPISRAEPLKSEIKPDYLAQQLIERIIHRCYEFRENREIEQAATENKKALAHAYAVQRYHEYMSKQSSPADRLQKALGNKGEYSDFIKYLMIGMDDFIQTFGQQHEQIAAVIVALGLRDNFPKMPVLYKGVLTEYDPKIMTNPAEVNIAYNVQNVVEQLILVARTHGDKFEAWNKAQQRNSNSHANKN